MKTVSQKQSLAVVGMLGLIFIGFAAYYFMNSGVDFLKKKTGPQAMPPSQHRQRRDPLVPIPPTTKQSALKFPSQDAPLRLKERHINLIYSLAVDTPTLNIKECAPDPFVAQISTGKEIGVVNNDLTPHTLKEGARSFLTIPAGGKKSFTAAQVFGEIGAHAYTCDDSRENVGIFLIVE